MEHNCQKCGRTPGEGGRLARIHTAYAVLMICGICRREYKITRTNPPSEEALSDIWEKVGFIKKQEVSINNGITGESIGQENSEELGVREEPGEHKGHKFTSRLKEPV